MSVQASRIIGYGYKFPYEEKLFSFLKNEDEESDFIYAADLGFNYYSMYDVKTDKGKPMLKIVRDGMNAEYKTVLFIFKVIDLFDTHGHYEPWIREFADNDFVKQYAKKFIETLLQRKLDEEPKELDFEHYE